MGNKATSTAKRKAAAPPSDTTDLGAGRRNVRATRTGYYEHTVRQVGDVFVQDDAISPFSAKWMEEVDADEPEKITGSNAVIQQEHDRILSERSGSASGAPAGASSGSTGDANVLGD